MLNDVLMAPCHHFRIHVVLNHLSSLYNDLCTKVKLCMIKRGILYEV